MIYLMILLLGMTIGFTYWAIKAESVSYIELIPTVLATCAGVILFICFIAIPIEYADSLNFVEQHQAYKDTLQISREKGLVSEAERVEVLSKILDHNAKLAKTQYWNKSWFSNWYISDKVTDLKPLQ